MPTVVTVQEGLCPIEESYLKPLYFRSNSPGLLNITNKNNSKLVLIDTNYNALAWLQTDSKPISISNVDLNLRVNIFGALMLQFNIQLIGHSLSAFLFSFCKHVFLVSLS